MTRDGRGFGEGAGVAEGLRVGVGVGWGVDFGADEGAGSDGDARARGPGSGVSARAVPGNEPLVVPVPESVPKPEPLRSGTTRCPSLKYPYQDRTTLRYSLEWL